jgi:hypothetical protein
VLTAAALREVMPEWRPACQSLFSFLRNLQEKSINSKALVQDGSQDLHPKFLQKFSSKRRGMMCA